MSFQLSAFFPGWYDFLANGPGLNIRCCCIWIWAVRKTTAHRNNCSRDGRSTYSLQTYQDIFSLLLATITQEELGHSVIDRAHATGHVCARTTPSQEPNTIVSLKKSLLIKPIFFALVWSRLCPYYTRRGHGCTRTTLRFIWVSLDGNYVRKNNCRQYGFENDHQGNNAPKWTDHKNIRLQSMPTNAVAYSLDPTWGALAWGTSDWAWVNILHFLFHCCRYII